MGFRFPLETLLRVRQGLERREELLLAEANHAVTLRRQQMAQVDGAVAELAARRVRQLQSGLSAAEMQFDLLCRSALMDRRQVLEKELAQAQDARARRQQAFYRARQQREVLDTLRNHQQEDFREQDSRNQQRQFDELFLRRAHRQHG